MSRHILVALDGSKASEKALNIALELAPNHDDRFTLVHVVPDRNVPESVRRFAESEHMDGPPEWVYEKLIAENILIAGQRIVASKSAAKVESIVAHGDPAAMIVKEAKKTGADMVVMGTRGVSDFEGLVFGSVAHRVAHHAAEETNATVVVVK